MNQEDDYGDETFRSELPPRITCSVCKRDVSVNINEAGLMRLTTHGTVVLGSKRPYRVCRGSGKRVVDGKHRG